MAHRNDINNWESRPKETLRIVVGGPRIFQTGPYISNLTYTHENTMKTLILMGTQTESESIMMTTSVYTFNSLLPSNIVSYNPNWTF